MGEPHQLERRATGLAQALVRQKDTIRQYVAPEGQRLPFTEVLKQPKALAWWKAHINDKYGTQVLKQMQALDIIKLHQALQEADMASPEQVTPPPEVPLV